MTQAAFFLWLLRCPCPRHFTALCLCFPACALSCCVKLWALCLQLVLCICCSPLLPMCRLIFSLHLGLMGTTSHSFWILSDQWGEAGQDNFKRQYVLTCIAYISQGFHDSGHCTEHTMNILLSKKFRIQKWEGEKLWLLDYAFSFLGSALWWYFTGLPKRSRLRGWRWSDLFGDCAVVTDDILSSICVQCVGFHRSCL